MDITDNISKYIRGYFKKICFKKSGKRIFIGKRTSIKYCKNIVIGDYVDIKDYVEINARMVNSVILGSNIIIGKYSIIKSDFSDKKQV